MDPDNRWFRLHFRVKHIVPTAGALDGIHQLNLISGTGLAAVQLVKDSRYEDVAAKRRQLGRRFAGRGLLDDVDHLVDPVPGAGGGDDAEAADLVPGHSPQREDRCTGLGMRIHQLFQDRPLVAKDHVVRQQHGAGLAFDKQPRGPHRMAQAEGLLLLHVRDDELVAQLVDLGEDVEQVALASLLEVVLKLQRPVEVVDDGSLAAACDHDHLLDSAGDRLLDTVLDGRLVDQRKHLFRLRLGHRQEPRAETGGGKDRLPYSGA